MSVRVYVCVRAYMGWYVKGFTMMLTQKLYRAADKSDARYFSID